MGRPEQFSGSQLDWHLTLSYPSDIRHSAERLDSIIWSVLETITRSVIPRAGGHNVFEVGEVNWLHGSTFQQILVPQPIKLGGLGIRSLVETSPAAFVGGVEMSLPHFTGQRAICPLLQEVVGTLDGDSRWVTFLANESRTSGEFKDSWDSLTREAREYSTYLGGDPRRSIIPGGGEGWGCFCGRKYQEEDSATKGVFEAQSPWKGLIGPP